jgi:hypothetical protein
MPIPHALGGFDVTAAVGRMLDQPAIWWQAVGLFVEHFADWERAWQDCIGDDAREQKIVHALRSAAANVGATELAELAEVLETRLLRQGTGQPSTVSPALRQRLRDSFRQVWQTAANARESAVPGIEWIA